MRVNAYLRTNRKGNPMARLPLLRDFQMVGSGYGDSPWEKLMVPKLLNSRSRNDSGAKVTHRYYLQDIAFAVAHEVPFVFEADLGESLDNPVWPLYLGRNCCVPSELINQGPYMTAFEAMRAGAAIAAGNGLGPSALSKSKLKVSFLLSTMCRPRSGEHKRYQVRQVTVLKTS
jgi:CRISPR system Cascade subunit CasD